MTMERTIDTDGINQIFKGGIKLQSKKENRKRRVSKNL
jgi:hypothetical protein